MGRGLPSDWQSIREDVLERDGYTCGNCKRRGGPYGDLQLEVHHIVERQHGGTNELSNLRTLCSDCHASITYGRPAPTAYQEFRYYRRHLGTTKGHVAVFIFFGWWTLGLANLLYAYYSYRTSVHERGLLERMEEAGENFMELAESVEEEYQFDDCPICHEGTVEQQRGIPPSTYSCSACEAKFKQKVLSTGLVAQFTLVEGASSRVGETRTIPDWNTVESDDSEPFGRSMPSHSGDESPTHD